MQSFKRLAVNDHHPDAVVTGLLLGPHHRTTSSTETSPAPSENHDSSFDECPNQSELGILVRNLTVVAQRLFNFEQQAVSLHTFLPLSAQAASSNRPSQRENMFVHYLHRHEEDLEQQFGFLYRPNEALNPSQIPENKLRFLYKLLSSLAFLSREFKSGLSEFSGQYKERELGLFEATEIAPMRNTVIDIGKQSFPYRFVVENPEHQNKLSKSLQEALTARYLSKGMADPEESLEKAAIVVQTLSENGSDQLGGRRLSNDELLQFQEQFPFQVISRVDLPIWAGRNLSVYTASNTESGDRGTLAFELQPLDIIQLKDSHPKFTDPLKENDIDGAELVALLDNEIQSQQGSLCSTLCTPVNWIKDCVSDFTHDTVERTVVVSQVQEDGTTATHLERQNVRELNGNKLMLLGILLALNGLWIPFLAILASPHGKGE